MSSDFWALRDTFLQPIAEIEVVADKLNCAANAVINEKFELARSLINECDLPELRNYRSLIVEGLKEHIHRVRDVPNSPPFTKVRKERMPSKKVSLSVFRRDGWRCRFCGIRILSLDAIKKLDELFPNEVRWRQKPYKNRNIAFNIMASSLDHILPHSRGGDNDPSNLVGSCGSCQFGRMQYTLAEVGFTDPRDRNPIVDSWDGLERLITFA